MVIDRIVGDCLEIAGACLESERVLKLSGARGDGGVSFWIGQ